MAECVTLVYPFSANDKRIVFKDSSNNEFPVSYEDLNDPLKGKVEIAIRVL